MSDAKEAAYATIKSNLLRLSSCGIDYRLEIFNSYDGKNYEIELFKLAEKIKK